jgi:hypothetical protein
MNLKKINEAKSLLRKKGKFNSSTIPIGNHGLSIKVTKSYKLKEAKNSPDVRHRKAQILDKKAKSPNMDSQKSLT